MLREMSLAPLCRYDVGRLRPGSGVAKRHPQLQPADGERLPTLDEVISLFRRECAPPTRLVVELKTDPTRPTVSASPEQLAERAIAMLRARGVTDRAQIIAFDWRVSRHAQRLAPEIPTSYLVFEGRASRRRTRWASRSTRGR